MKDISRLIAGCFLVCHRIIGRIWSKAFSLLSSGAFAHFGSKTTLVPPIRLSGESRISIGDRVFVGAGSWLHTLPDGASKEVALTIGDGTSMSGLCVIAAVRSVVLEENVLLARNVYISDHSHRFTDTTQPVLRQGVDSIRPVWIKAGAWLGQNVVVCPGVTIGTGAVVGANSVVTKDVPDFSVAVGSPARIVRSLAVLSH